MLALMPSMSNQFAVDVYARTASTLGLRFNLGRLHLTQPQVSQRVASGVGLVTPKGFEPYVLTVKG